MTFSITYCFTKKYVYDTGRALSFVSCGQTQERFKSPIFQEGDMSVIYIGIEDTRSQSSMRSSYAEVNRF